MNDGDEAPAPDASALTARLERAVQAQDFAAAFRLAEQAAAFGAPSPLAYRLHGADLERQGRSGEAVAMFERALGFAPDDAATLNALGFSQTKLGRLAQGAATLRRAARLAPGFAPIAFNLGSVLERQGRLNGAQAAYARALQLDPAHAEAMASLAVLHARRSRWPLARSQAQAALTLSPNLPAAHLALAMSDLGEAKLDQTRARLDALIAGPTLPPLERAVALNLLGETLDRRGEVKGAFTAYSAANAGFRRLFGAACADEPPTGLALARQLQAQLHAPALATAAPRAQAPAASPVFLLSFPRSATTLTGQVLAAHRDVVVSDEQELLVDAGLSFLAPADGLQRLARADASSLDAYRQAYWRRVRETGFPITPGEGVFVDKLPMNTLALPVIARLFPGAKVIFMLRDPRDVVWSCFRQRFIGSGIARDFTELERTAALYDAVMTLGRTWGRMLDLDVRFQSYERLVSHFDAETAALCDFLGLASDAGMMDFAGGVSTRDVATPSAVQIARGLNADSIGQWRRYAAPMAGVLPQLAPWVKAFGYSPD